VFIIESIGRALKSSVPNAPIEPINRPQSGRTTLSLLSAPHLSLLHIYPQCLLSSPVRIAVPFASGGRGTVDKCAAAEYCLRQNRQPTIAYVLFCRGTEVEKHRPVYVTARETVNKSWHHFLPPYHLAVDRSYFTTAATWIEASRILAMDDS